MKEYIVKDDGCRYDCPFFSSGGGPAIEPYCTAKHKHIDTYLKAPNWCPAVEGVLVKRKPE